MNLLTTLSYSLPDFASSLLAQAAGENQSHILVYSCRIIRDHLEPSKKDEHTDALARETLTLLESLCFNIADNTAST